MGVSKDTPVFITKDKIARRERIIDLEDIEKIKIEVAKFEIDVDSMDSEDIESFGRMMYNDLKMRDTKY